MEKEPGTLTTVLVGRQPIFSRHVEVYAYELLFRGGSRNQASFTDGDMATSQVMLNTFLEIGLDQIVQDCLAFINLTKNFILGEHCLALPKDRVVLEILENVEIDDDVIHAVRRLSEKGYLIALDDFVFKPEWQPLVELANIIKVDITQLNRDAITEHVRLLEPHDVKLLAEKVETHEEFEFCQTLGFDYFQGYFLCKPHVVSAKRIPANRMAMLALLADLQNPDLDIIRLEGIIKQDVGLSLKILRYVNSAFVGLPRHVDSINQAVCMVGLERLKTWATLMMLASVDDKPKALMVTAILRGRMCEQLALAAQEPDAGPYFTVGLFSILDAFFDMPMADLIPSLPLSQEVIEALVMQTGELGRTLKCVLAYERGDWESVEDFGLDEEILKKVYLEALSWTHGLLPMLKT